MLLLLALLTQYIGYGSSLQVVSYSTEIKDLNTDGEAWTQWQVPPEDKNTSPTSNVDDGPFERAPFCFPYFTVEDGVGVWISPNGFISVSPQPLCFQDKPPQPSQYFCHQTLKVEGESIPAYYKLWKQEETNEYIGGNHPIIGLFVEDLNPKDSESAQIYWWKGPDSLTVSYHSVPVYGHPEQNVTAQVEIFSETGEIIFRYESVTDADFIGETNAPPFLGLIWTQSQRVNLGWVGDLKAVRLVPEPDTCGTRDTCAACVPQSGCEWCESLQRCVSSTANADGDFCTGINRFNDTCEFPVSYPDLYKQTITYGIDNPIDLATSGKASNVTGGGFLMRLRKSLRFFFNPPDDVVLTNAVGLEDSDVLFIPHRGLAALGLPVCAGLVRPCPQRNEFLHIIAPFWSNLNAELSQAPIFYEQVDEHTLVVQWQGTSPIGVPGGAPSPSLSSLRFQVIIYADGRIAFRYLSADPVATPTVDTASYCPRQNVWVAHPLRIGLYEGSESGVHTSISWQLLRPGMQIVFEPLLGCPVLQCAQGQCNHDTLRCGCVCDQGVCELGDFSDGSCVECLPHWAGETCDTNCTCNPAQGVCRAGVQGDGTCTSACFSKNWALPNCDTCSPKHYGPDCTPCECQTNQQCSDGLQGNGTCGACDDGWEGDTCDQCAVGYWGTTCKKCSCQNGVCNDGATGNGKCLECDPDWAGPTCALPCSCSQYGNCSQGIAGLGMCESCSPGWATISCNKKCDCVHGVCNDGPHGNGKCLVCDRGYAGSACDIGCTKCNMTNGECLATDDQQCSCLSGWDSEKECNECKEGFFGPECVPCTCASAHGSCDWGTTGTGKCSKCLEGYYGENCDAPCKCSPDHGFCSFGIIGTGECAQCNQGKTGPLCTECINGGTLQSNCTDTSGVQPPVTVVEEDNTPSVFGIVVIIIIFAFMLLCGCVFSPIVMFMMFRRKPRQRSPVGAVVVERSVSGDREVIPIQRLPIQQTPVQGIPLQQVPLSQLRNGSTQEGNPGASGNPADSGVGSTVATDANNNIVVLTDNTDAAFQPPPIPSSTPVEGNHHQLIHNAPVGLETRNAFPSPPPL